MCALPSVLKEAMRRNSVYPLGSSGEPREVEARSAIVPSGLPMTKSWYQVLFARLPVSRPLAPVVLQLIDPPVDDSMVAFVESAATPAATSMVVVGEPELFAVPSPAR